jgi:large subunit ribosomal protein L29
VATAQELRDLTPGDLEIRLLETKEELFNLRFQNATGQLDNYKRLGQLRKDVARIKTLIRQNELQQVSNEAGGDR